MFSAAPAAKNSLLSFPRSTPCKPLPSAPIRTPRSSPLEISRAHALGDQVALEALVRMTDEEIKHQELFRRLEALMAADMPAGYRPTAEPNAVAAAVLGKSTWAVLALTLHIVLFTQAHYRASIAAEADICELWRDVFLFHWKEESQHAVLNELEFLSADARLTPAQRDIAVDELIELVGAVDQILQAQAAADAAYFLGVAQGDLSAVQRERPRQSGSASIGWQRDNGCRHYSPTR